MQNSGLGNIINPVASLLNDKVYGIPCIFIVGWRGEPGLKDEPQHIYQGEVTIKLLEDIDIATFIISKETTEEELQEKILTFKPLLDMGKSVAFVIRKDALSYEEKVVYENKYTMLREEIIRHIVTVSGEDIIVSTTGKASRELFEIREQNRQSHKYDFLTVGSMGHSSSIALGVALNKPNCKVWCIDGDGAALMHMGAMAVIGSNSPQNMVHVLINNNVHETVGGMPTVAEDINFVQIALGCGYPAAVCVDNLEDLDKALKEAKKSNSLIFIEARASIGSRENLGRPTTTAMENKENFMNYLKEID
jgi:phosphonopyruvate decarboxylase